MVVSCFLKAVCTVSYKVYANVYSDSETPMKNTLATVQTRVPLWDYNFKEMGKLYVICTFRLEPWPSQGQPLLVQCSTADANSTSAALSLKH